VIGAGYFVPGCASFSPDAGMGIVKDIAHTELNSDVVALNTEDRVSTARLEVDRLLKRPLTEAAAVRISLLKNRDLQAAYNALGISEAEKCGRRQSVPTKKAARTTRRPKNSVNE